MLHSEVPHLEDLYRYEFTGFSENEKSWISLWIENGFDPHYLVDAWLIVEWLVINGYNPTNPNLQVPDHDEF